jgi:hypothetical protein
MDQTNISLKCQCGYKAFRLKTALKRAAWTHIICPQCGSVLKFPPLELMSAEKKLTKIECCMHCTEWNQDTHKCGVKGAKTDGKDCCEGFESV